MHATYLQVTAHVPDNRSGSVEWAYGDVMWFYTVS
jgi:hypothetical protein